MGNRNDFLIKGISFYEAGKYGPAKECFEVGVANGDFESWLYLAKTYYATNETDKAKSTLFGLLAKDPNHADALQLFSQWQGQPISSKSEEVGDAQKQKTIGVFSVGPKKRVTFAPGNLIFKASTGEYDFAYTQFSTMGNKNAKISQYYDDWIDLFGWGTGDCPYKITEDDSKYRHFANWGEHIQGQWRVLTKDEWVHLLKARPNADAKHGFATVNGVRGLMILPDDWKGFFNDQKVDFNDNVYANWNQWGEMEKKGVVFLPFTGMRDGGKYYSSWIGRYWMEEPFGEDSAYLLYINDKGVDINMAGRRHYGSAVRLVKDLKK